MADGGSEMEDKFKQYASEGKGTEVTVKDVTRWCKEAKLLGQNLDMPNIQKSFETIKSGSRTLKFSDMDRLIMELAQKYKDDKKVGISQAKIDVTNKLLAVKPSGS